MTDLEIVRKCADRIGIKHRVIDDTYIDYYEEGLMMWRGYSPIHDDAQAMALVKRFNLDIDWKPLRKTVTVQPSDCASSVTMHFSNGDLNRAICECVAKLP